jgi:hypothetical protein
MKVQSTQKQFCSAELNNYAKGFWKKTTISSKIDQIIRDQSIYQENLELKYMMTRIARIGYCKCLKLGGTHISARPLPVVGATSQTRCNEEEAYSANFCFSARKFDSTCQYFISLPTHTVDACRLRNS